MPKVRLYKSEALMKENIVMCQSLDVDYYCTIIYMIIISNYIIIRLYCSLLL